MHIKEIEFDNNTNQWVCGRYREDTLLDLYEFLTRTGLYYPYHISIGYDGHTEADYTECHEHSFERVLGAISNHWNNGFSIKGYEEYYSKQEQEMIAAILNAHRTDTWAYYVH